MRLSYVLLWQGIEPSIRAEVWQLLLGVYNLDSSEAEREATKAQNREMIDDLNNASVCEFMGKEINQLLRSNGGMLLSEQKIRAVVSNAKQMQKVLLLEGGQEQSKDSEVMCKCYLTSFAKFVVYDCRLNSLNLWLLHSILYVQVLWFANIM